MDAEMEGTDHQPATKGDIRRLEAATKADISRLETATKADISRLETATKADFGRLEGEFGRLEATMKTDIGRLEARTTELASGLARVDGNVRRLNVGFARMEGRFAALEEKVDGLLSLRGDFAGFQTALDLICRRTESMERWYLAHGSMLMEHERRITKLEGGPH